MAVRRNFRVTYRNASCHPWQARVVSARSRMEATGLCGDPDFIRNISIQCAGLTAKGDPCQRFTPNDYCCESHHLNAYLESFNEEKGERYEN